MIAIGELARRTGVKVVTIRWYEGQGLVAAAGRTTGGSRLFDEAAERRLAFVRAARELGFSFEEVRDMLRLSDQPAGAPGLAEEAARHLAATEHRTRTLASLRRALSLLARGDPGFEPRGLLTTLASPVEAAEDDGA